MMTLIMPIRLLLLKRTRRRKKREMSIVILKSWKKKAMIYWRRSFNLRSTSLPMKMNNRWSKILQKLIPPTKSLTLHQMPANSLSTKKKRIRMS
jgi:hypothetical protein